MNEARRPHGFDRDRRAHERGARDRGIGKLEVLDAGQGVGAVRRARALVDNYEGLGGRVVGNRVIGLVARIYCGVGAVATDDGVIARPAGDRVVAETAVQRIGDGVADDSVVAGSADGVVDVGACVAIVEIGVVDVARGVMAVTEIRQLHGGEHRRSAGIEVEAQVRRVVRQVVGIDAAAVPDRLVDAVGRAADPAARRELPDAVDGLLPRGRIPGVDGAAALGRIVSAVHRLEREDIVRHVGLRISVRFIGVAARGRSADIAAIAHDGVFAAVMRARHCDVGGAAGLLAVLEAEGMAELVQRGREVIIAELGQREIVLGAEPDVAAGRVVAGIVGVGRRIGRRRLRDHDVGTVGARVLDVGVGVAEDQPDRVVDRRLDLGGRRTKARPSRLAVATVVGIGIVARRVGKAIGDRAGPFVTGQQAVDLGVVGGTDTDSGGQLTLQSNALGVIRH